MKKKKKKILIKIKRLANRLIVDDVSDVLQGDGDNSCILLSQIKMKQLGLFCGDTVLIKGKKRHNTICIALPNEPNDEVENEPKDGTKEWSLVLPG